MLPFALLYEDYTLVGIWTLDHEQSNLTFNNSYNFGLQILECVKKPRLLFYIFYVFIYIPSCLA